ncbi:winged helix DNA-binding protein [Saccharibacter sp. 17.LH.SD]|nr:winged helix DNA-binding protein [Saccharibacter sp. 17.LH.SD]
MTSRLRRLADAGFIERFQNPADKRGYYVRLTEKGRKVMKDIIPLHIDNERQLLLALSQEDQHTLNRLLKRLTNHWA